MSVSHPLFDGISGEVASPKMLIKLPRLARDVIPVMKAGAGHFSLNNYCFFTGIKVRVSISRITGVVTT